MKDKNVVSWDRIRTACILVQEFSILPFLTEKKAIAETAGVMNVLPETINRYIRVSGYRPNYRRIQMGPDENKLPFPNAGSMPAKIRAIMVLKRSGFKYEEIGRNLHLSSEAVRKRYKRFLTQTSLLIT